MKKHELEDTGERIIPERMAVTNGMLLEHLARYQFATSFVHGRVLDIACGTGYGSKMIAKMGKGRVTEVIAADRSEDALLYARSHHYHPNVHCIQADANDPDLDEQLGQFDTIVSFETIEHVEDDRYFIQQMNRLLRPGGTLIVSTPFGQGRGKPTKQKFHYYQLTVEEFCELFDAFSATTMYYQKGVLIELPRADQHYPFGIAVAVKGVEKNAPLQTADVRFEVTDANHHPTYSIERNDGMIETVHRKEWEHRLQKWQNNLRN